MTSIQKTGIKQVNCPGCQRLVPWTADQQYRPFCSRKCQLLDFGEWASENYGIPVDASQQTETEIDQDDEQWSRD